MSLEELQEMQGTTVTYGPSTPTAIPTQVKVVLHRYKDGMGWELTFPSTQEAIAAHKELLREVAEDGGWGPPTKTYKSELERPRR